VRHRLALLVSILLVATACAAPTAHAAGVVCTANSATVLFWPTGHKAIPSVGFPSIATPHLEVYRKTAPYRGTDFLLYADYKGNVDPSRSICVAMRGGRSSPMANAKTTRKRKALVCPNIPSIRLTTVKTRHTLKVRGQALSRLFDITLRRKTRTSGSTMTYDSSLCHLIPTPH
jgi:hypothetical protein